MLRFGLVMMKLGCLPNRFFGSVSVALVASVGSHSPFPMYEGYEGYERPEEYGGIHEFGRNLEPLAIRATSDDVVLASTSDRAIPAPPPKAIEVASSAPFDLAAAVAVGDHATALRLAAQGPELELGSEAWVWRSAARARAFRLAGQPERAVQELDATWGIREAHEHFPKDILGFELASAKHDWARTLSPTQADEQRDQALSILTAVRGHSPLRNLPEVRVLLAEVMLALRGPDPVAQRRAATRAASLSAQVLADYPYHPRIGEIWLGHAQALERAGKVGDASAQYLDIYLRRAGEREAEAAWEQLRQLADKNPNVRLPTLHVGDEIDRAVAARGLKQVELSRQILDRILDDPNTSPGWRIEAQRQRAFTAYKQRDFAQCARDLEPRFAATGNQEIRGELIRCLERGAMYEEALSLWKPQASAKGAKTPRLHAQWELAELAFRSGRYAEAEQWLREYEKASRGHPATRTWLHAWLPMRQGRIDEAIAAFKVAERFGPDRDRARYFRGKLLLQQPDEVAQREGVDLLHRLIETDPFAYYALQARQRLIAAGADVPPTPILEPLAEAERLLTRSQIETTFDELDRSFGERWPAIRRARQLYGAGYLEESRREVRIAIEAFMTHGRPSGGPRHEAFEGGSGWRAVWKSPRVAPTKAGLKDLRSSIEREQLRLGLRELALGLEDPHQFIRLGDPNEGHWKARWQPRAYRWTVEREARLRAIDPVHLWSLMYAESRFRRFVVSPVGARGALQIMPWTAQQLVDRLGEGHGVPFDDDRLFDIDVNAHLSAYYVAELLHKFHGQGPLAYASYNGGPSNVARWLAAKSSSPTPLEMDVFIEEMAFEETYRYTKRVMEVSAVYGLLYDGELRGFVNQVDPEFEDNIDF